MCSFMRKHLCYKIKGITCFQGQKPWLSKIIKILNNYEIFQFSTLLNIKENCIFINNFVITREQIYACSCFATRSTQRPVAVGLSKARPKKVSLMLIYENCQQNNNIVTLHIIDKPVIKRMILWLDWTLSTVNWQSKTKKWGSRAISKRRAARLWCSRHLRLTLSSPLLIVIENSPWHLKFDSTKMFTVFQPILLLRLVH